MADGARPAAATTTGYSRHRASTPSQTAWALLALLAAGDDRSDSIAKGIRWLLTRQRADGSWDESMGEGPTHQAIITGTGFPGSFTWLRMYRQYFPLSL